jgi:succinoglycan biosynthesis transport protein ExoP
MRISVNFLHSRFADALRSARLCTEKTTPKRKGRIIGIVSTVYNEGKSTLSANFAQLLADSGERVLLIDADFRCGSLSSELASPNMPGAIEVAQGKLPLEAALIHDTETGLEFLCSGDRRAVAKAAAFANSKTFTQFVDRLSDEYNWVILDLPPLIPVIDAQAVADVIDAFVLVIEWAATPRHIVTRTLEASQFVHRKVAGCVFNKVNIKRMATYEPQLNLRYCASYYTEA